MPSEMRPREEMKRRGAQAMDIEKLMAIVMRSGQPGQNVVEMARDLICKAGGLETLSHMSYIDILGLKIPGIGEVKAMELSAAFEIGRRAVANTASAEPKKISRAEDVYEIMQPYVRGKQQEYFYIILLDSKSKMVGQPILVVTGTHDRCPASPMEIFSPVVKSGCTAAILVHNHPSGDPTPSPEDVKVTVRMVDAAKILGLRLLDHIVIGQKSSSSPRGYVSISGEGLVVFR